MKSRIPWILAGIVMLVLCFALFAGAGAETGGMWGDLSWTLDDEGVLTISGNGSMNDFSYYSSDAWRAEKDSIKSVVISDSVTSIGDSAFYNCSSLTEITIPAGVTSIGDSAFCYCSSLTELAIPAGVTSIGEYAFSACTGLTKITIPAGVTSIGEYAFSDCDRLTEITIPACVTSIA